ncbi:MAG: S9 family peptidase [Prevotella sp.]|nr:S9 family peptidase [Prevotella sp.]
MKIKNLGVGLNLFLLSICGLMTMQVQAQELKQFTLEDLNFGGKNYHNLSPKNRWYAWWGDQLVRQDAEKCLLVNPTTGKETLLFNLEDVNRAAKSGSDSKLFHSAFSTSFPYSKQPLALLANGSQQILYNFKTRQIEWRQSTEAAQAEEWCPASRSLAFVRQDNLYVTDGDGKTIQLTRDGSRQIVYGQSVHRDEFGISKGLFWNVTGDKLAFYRMDQSMVADYPQVDIFNRMATCKPDKYPMAGETSHKVTIGIYDLKTKQVVYLKAGDPTDRYFTNIAWGPDNATVYLFELNRDQNDCRLVSYDAATGEKLKELYRETDSRYVEPLHPIQFLPWDDSKFIMQSQKDGYNHLYLMSADGREIKQLTSGSWVVLDVLGFNPKAKAIVYTSNEISPIQTNSFMVNVNSGRKVRLGDATGWHTPSLSEGGQYLLDRYSAPDVPRNIDLISTSTAKTRRLFTADDPWKGYAVPEYTCGKIKADDGTTDLFYRMVKPVGFDPNRKYPTVVYVYGGPHAHNVDARWHYGSRSWETYMAQKGYLLFILDNRGSENRGKAFEQATFRQLGQAEMKDQMKGVEYLKTLPYVDQDRMGVHGWSFGGFMTISLMTNYPDVFKVGVAGGPVIDWKWYEVMYGERYMDTPQTNPEGYSKTSLLAKAKDLKGKLQIITGYNDPTVVPQHALSFIAECIKHGTQPDFFVYPGEPHNMRGHQSVHLHERITQYFEDYLKPLNQKK